MMNVMHGRGASSLMSFLLAAWWLAAGSAYVQTAEAASPVAQAQGVSRPAPGVSRPVTPSGDISPKERRRIVKARIAYLNKKITSVEQRVAKARNKKQQRILKVKVDFLRGKLARLIRGERHVASSAKPRNRRPSLK